MARGSGVEALKKRKKFAKELVNNGGNKMMAYHKVWGSSLEASRRRGSLIAKDEVVREEIGKILEKKGVSRDMLAGNMAKVLKQNEDLGAKTRMIELGFKLHGDLQGKDGGVNLTQVNYHVSDERLDSAMDKINNIANRMGMINGYPDGEIDDVEVITDYDYDKIGLGYEESSEGVDEGAPNE